MSPGLDREVHADVPAGNREAQRRLVARAEQLEHVEERVVPGALDVDDDPLELLDRLGRHHELVLHEPGRAVGAVPLTEHVERVIELRQVLDLAAVGARLAVPELADRPEGVLVGQSRWGTTSGNVSSCGASNFSGSFCSFVGQLVERGQRAAGDGGAAQLRRRADRVEPGAGVRVVVLAAVAVEGDGLVEAGGDVAVGDEVRGLGRRHRDGGAQDDAGQPVAADRGPEQLGLRRRPG